MLEIEHIYLNKYPLIIQYLHDHLFKYITINSLT